MNKDESISGALGITEDWRDENGATLLGNLQGNDTISDAILAQIKSIKKKEFNITDETLSTPTEYERKLMWTGMELAFIMVKKKQHSTAAASAFAEMLKSIAEGLSESHKIEAKKTRKKKNEE